VAAPIGGCAAGLGYCLHRGAEGAVRPLRRYVTYSISISSYLIG